MNHTKHDILAMTGATSEQYDRAFRKFFGTVEIQGSNSIPEIWIAQFLKSLTKRIR
jgi:hypothetical protein